MTHVKLVGGAHGLTPVAEYSVKNDTDDIYSDRVRVCIKSTECYY